MPGAIAVLGWGSLIWSPRALEIRGGWLSDGPSLPIEFARISGKTRHVTLVIHPGAEPQRTYWAVAKHDILDDARDNLRDREDTALRHVHCVTRWSNPSTAVEAIVLSWIEEHPEVDSAIWTGLPCNWREQTGREYTVERAVEYLLGLEGDAAKVAREYVCRAPPQIQTELRRRMQARGWLDVTAG